MPSAGRFKTAMAKIRLDSLLVERGLVPSRERAKSCIMEGLVFVNGEREDKPGASFHPDKIRSVEVKADPLPYVSRGGLKLEKALTLWGLALSNAICLDIGASTGGFTDVMLQNGAKKVYAVDSGTNQLDYRLRTDARVVCMEQTNFRYITKQDIPEDIAFAGADVSFISLAKILPAAYPLLIESANMVCLVKPQFEAGREFVGKHGVVKDARVHAKVLHRVIGEATDIGFTCEALSFSPVQGPKGNIEYLLLLKKTATPVAQENSLPVDAVVREAHDAFQQALPESGAL